MNGSASLASAGRDDIRGVSDRAVQLAAQGSACHTARGRIAVPFGSNS